MKIGRLETNRHGDWRPWRREDYTRLSKKVIQGYSCLEILERFKALEDQLSNYHELIAPIFESLKTRRWNEQCQTNFNHLLNVQWRMQ